MNKNLNKFLDQHGFVIISGDDKFIEVPSAVKMWGMLPQTHMFDDMIVNMYDAYIEFLKTPLTLGMFVATDENGSLLEFKMPQNHPWYDEGRKFFEQQYQEAQENVIFGGWRDEKSIRVGSAIDVYIKNIQGSSVRITTKGVFLYKGKWKVRTVGDLNALVDLYVKPVA